MKAGEVVLQELLNGKVQYRVPLFQRTYSWGDKEWKRLWSDICEIYRLVVPRTHFIGAVVTLPLPDSPEHTSKFMLIDGQQRLTTLFILLSCLRDLARRDPALVSLADQIEEECLINKFAKHKEERLKLLPTQADRCQYSAIVDQQPVSNSNRIAAARAYFENALQQNDDEDQPFDLARLKSCVTDYLALVSIRLDQADSPYRIFESLNNTGMALTDSDLIRNDIFMRMDEGEQAEAYEAHWLPMQQRMEYNRKSWLSDFFWRYAMVDGDQPRYDEVYQAVKADIDKSLRSGRTAMELLQEFDDYSKLYLLIWRPQDAPEPDVEVARRAVRLRQWEVDVAYPFLMSAYHLREKGDLSSADLAQVLAMLESFVVRRLICAVPTNRLRSIFARMPQRVVDGEYVDNCREYLLENDWPSDDLFVDRFQEARIYSSRLGRTRLILTSLEEAFEHHEPVSMDSVTIEHIMPQCPDQSWKQALGQGWREVRERYLHTVGNLTYSGYNQEMGNMSFGKKKQILQKSHFELNREIIAVEQWGEREINARAARMAELAVGVWSR